MQRESYQKGKRPKRHVKQARKAANKARAQYLERYEQRMSADREQQKLRNKYGPTGRPARVVVKRMGVGDANH